MKTHFDIAVIGGGAGGLFFTALAARSNKSLRIALFEKNEKVGKKLLATGNGRCNLTNINATKACYHGSFAPFMETCLKLCPPEKITEIFAELGLVIRKDPSGRIYPKSNQASTVLDVLRFNCDQSNVTVLCGSPVISAEKKGALFYIKTEKETVTASKLIIATGGAAAPKSGGSSSGYELLRSFGHTVIKPSAALCPVEVNSVHLKALKGIRVQGEVSLISDYREICREVGEIQFTEKSLSGICVFNLSQYIEKGKAYSLRLHLLSELEDKEISALLYRNRKLFATLDAECLMTGIFHKRLGTELLKEAKIKLNKAVAQITPEEISRLVALINSFDFQVIKTEGFDHAQITKGGVKGDEINPSTMESKVTDGLYIIGEAIDLNGDCGGYNLQFAFATGYLAQRGL